MGPPENPAARQSGICRRAELGFTLIELIVALAVVGLGLTLVGPRLTEWADRMAYSMREQRFEEAVAGLGNKARRDGRTLVLHSSGSSPPTAEPSPIDLPSGWILTVEPPISFRYDGICTGGTVRVRFAAGERSYRLHPPFCRLEPM
jgi:prepilin-type N-terminal cleavage/methylation domain-containing protein